MRVLRENQSTFGGKEVEKIPNIQGTFQEVISFCVGGGRGGYGEVWFFCGIFWDPNYN